MKHCTPMTVSYGRAIMRDKSSDFGNKYLLQTCTVNIRSELTLPLHSIGKALCKSARQRLGDDVL